MICYLLTLELLKYFQTSLTWLKLDDYPLSSLILQPEGIAQGLGQPATANAVFIKILISDMICKQKPEKKALTTKMSRQK